MGGELSNVKISEGIPPLGGQTNFREDGSTYGGWRVVMTPSGRRPGDIRDMAHQVLH